MPAKRKIDNKELLEMYSQGLSRAEIARQLNVTIPAVSKRIRYLSLSVDKSVDKVDQCEDTSLNVQEALRKHGVTLDYIAAKLKTHSDSKDPGISLRGLQEIGRILNLYRTEEDKVSSIVLIAQLAVEVQRRIGNENDE